MTDPYTLLTPAFTLTEEDFKGITPEGLTYICDICWKFEFCKIIIKLKELKYYDFIKGTETPNWHL